MLIDAIFVTRNALWAKANVIIRCRHWFVGRFLPFFFGEVAICFITFVTWMRLRECRKFCRLWRRRRSVWKEKKYINNTKKEDCFKRIYGKRQKSDIKHTHIRWHQYNFHFISHFFFHSFMWTNSNRTENIRNIYLKTHSHSTWRWYASQIFLIGIKNKNKILTSSLVYKWNDLENKWRNKEQGNRNMTIKLKQVVSINEFNQRLERKVQHFRLKHKRNHRITIWYDRGPFFPRKWKQSDISSLLWSHNVWKKVCMKNEQKKNSWCQRKRHAS